MILELSTGELLISVTAAALVVAFMCLTVVFGGSK